MTADLVARLRAAAQWLAGPASMFGIAEDVREAAAELERLSAELRTQNEANDMLGQERDAFQSAFDRITQQAKQDREDDVSWRADAILLGFFVERSFVSNANTGYQRLTRWTAWRRFGRDRDCVGGVFDTEAEGWAVVRTAYDVARQSSAGSEDA